MRVLEQHKILIGLTIVLSAGMAHADPSVSELWARSIESEMSGDYGQAFEIHSRIIPERKKSYITLLRAGWLLYQSGNYSKALSYYEKAAGQASGAVSPLLGAMNCHVAMGNTAKAEKVAKAIIVIDEHNYNANLQIAWLSYQNRKFPMAASYYQKLNRLYPEDLAVASGLGWSYLEQGWVKQARPIFEEILVVSPDYPSAARGLEICNKLD